jgi:hypothetical protein
MEELAAFVIQILIEFGIQLFGSLGFEWATGSDRKKADGTADDNGYGWLVLFAVIGGACGGISLVLVPNLLLPALWMRVLNLVLAPVAAGGMSYLFARKVWAAGGYGPRHHFWRGFVFALAFGLVRFAYAHR